MRKSAVILDLQKQQGWSEEKLLTLALRFISNDTSRLEEFKECLAQVAEDEKGTVAISGYTLIAPDGEALFLKMKSLGADWDAKRGVWEVPAENLEEALAASSALKEVENTDIFELQKQQGWSDEKLLALTLPYFEDGGPQGEFEAYLGQVAAQEKAATGSHDLAVVSLKPDILSQPAPEAESRKVVSPLRPDDIQCGDVETHRPQDNPLVFQIPAKHVESFRSEVDDPDLLPDAKEAAERLKRFRRRRKNAMVYTIPVTPDIVLDLEVFAGRLNNVADFLEDEDDTSPFGRKQNERATFYRGVVSTILEALKTFDGFPRRTRLLSSSAEPDFKTVPLIPENAGKLALLYEEKELVCQKCGYAVARFGFPRLADIISNNPALLYQLILAPLEKILAESGHNKLAALVSSYPGYVTSIILDYFQQKSVGGTEPNFTHLKVERDCSPKPTVEQILAQLSTERLLAIADQCGLAGVVASTREHLISNLVRSEKVNAEPVLIDMTRDELDLLFHAVGKEAGWWERGELTVILLKDADVSLSPGTVAVVNSFHQGGLYPGGGPRSRKVSAELVELGAEWNMVVGRWEVPKDKLEQALALSPKLKVVGTATELPVTRAGTDPLEADTPPAAPQQPAPKGNPSDDSEAVKPGGGEPELTSEIAEKGGSSKAPPFPAPTSDDDFIKLGLVAAMVLVQGFPEDEAMKQAEDLLGDVKDEKDRQELIKQGREYLSRRQSR